MQHPHDEHAEQAEEDGIQQADPAVDVEAHVGIVPPLGVEDRLQQPAGEVFERARDEQSADKEDRQAEIDRRQAVDDRQRAEAVDRAERAVQKAPVDKPPGRDGAVDALAAPAQKAVDEKAKDGPAEGFRAQKDPSPRLLFMQGIAEKPGGDGGLAAVFLLVPRQRHLARRVLPGDRGGVGQHQLDAVLLLSLIHI